VRGHVDHGADLGQPTHVLARPLHDDAAVERREIQRLRQVLHHRSRRHERPEEGSHGARGELVDAGIEVARHVPGVHLRVLRHGLPELGLGHAPERRGEVTPLRELRPTRRGEPPNLEVRRVRQRVERVLGGRPHARHDLLDDAAPRLVEAEDGGGAVAHGYGPFEEALEGHAPMTPRAVARGKRKRDYTLSYIKNRVPGADPSARLVRSPSDRGTTRRSAPCAEKCDRILPSSSPPLAQPPRP
jgi:hypothetical protein